MRRMSMIGTVVAGLLAASGGEVTAGRVELELATESGFPATEAQRWNQLLAELKVDGLRIRARRPGDKVEVQTGGTPQSPVYRVTGVLSARNELFLPGAKFTLRDGDRLAAWLADLGKHGPAGRGDEGLFGLSEDELAQAQSDLAAPFGIATRGASRPEVLLAFLETRQLMLALSRADLAALDPDDPVAEELQSLSCGTALAALLRPAGLALVPRRGRDGKLAYAVVRLEAGAAAWPVGVSAEDQRRTLLPRLFEFFNVEIDDYPLAEVLPALEKRLGVPLLVDHNALALAGIDLAAARVSLPAKRMTFSQALGSVARQARLKAQLRADEAGRPFIWISVFRPGE